MTPSALRGVLGMVGLGGEWEEGREERKGEEIGKRKGGGGERGEL